MSRFDDRPTGTPEFYASLPAKHVGAGCIFLDDEGRILLVNPTYKEPWEIPGGSVEGGESPWAACRREITEELGITRVPGRLLAVDHRGAVEGVRGDTLQFVFLGGSLSAAEVERIRLPPHELSEWRFVAAADLDEYLTPAMARRLRASLDATTDVYLEEGLARP